MSEAWAAHRAAIAVEEGVDLVSALRELLRCHDNDIDKTVEFLVWHGLAGLWSEALSSQPGFATHAEVPAIEWLNELRARLGAVQRQQLAHQLLQDTVARTASDALNRESISFVWLKAAAVRNELYRSPGLRPSTDLDLLVSPVDRERAIRALVSAGGSCVGSATPSSHEQVVQLRSVDLDVHWSVLAPGRLRESVTEEILRDRIVTDSGARPSNQHMLALALIHPAFAKHVCSRHMGLNRVADTLRMLRAWDFEAEDLVKLTKRWGGFTGARASLYWLSIISDSVCMSQLNKAFTVSAASWRDRYLARQIDQNWPDRWVDRSRWVLGLTFSVWLQDSPTDALKAVFARGLRASRRSSTSSALV
jgi:Uncharacterised nucleotidyltransferase